MASSLQGNLKKICVAELEKIVASDQGPVAKWNLAKNVLRDKGCSYTQTIRSSEVLVDVNNRGGLGLNHLNCHENGAAMHRMGADPSLLSTAVCVELKPLGSPGRQKTLDFNRLLVEQSGGTLAEVNGTERFATLGCGHTAAFIKAASCKSRVKTPQASIADAAGHLDVSLLKNNPEMAKLIDEGWQWLVLPDWVDEVDGFCHLVQQALNSSHGVVAAVTEMECAASIAKIFSQNPSGGLEAAIAQVGASNPHCSDYLPLVAEFARSYGGGAGAPLIQYLADFAKQYSVSLKLGKEFLSDLVGLKFNSVKSSFVHVKVAVVATQLTSVKQSDGIAKLLARSDLTALKKPTILPSVLQAETSLSHAWREVEEAKFSQDLALQQKALTAYGRLGIRLILHFTKKEKGGGDGTKYDSIADILKLHEEEKQTVKAASNTSASSTTAASKLQVMTELSDSRDIVKLIAGKYNLVAGKFYTCKNAVVADTGRIYQLEEVSKFHLKLKPWNPFKTESSISVKHNRAVSEELKCWSECKNKPPVLMPQGFLDQLQFRDAGLQALARKGMAFAALYDMAVAHPADGDLKMLSTCEFFARRKFKKGELKLIAMTDKQEKLLTKAGETKKKEDALMVYDGVEYVISPPASLPKLPLDEKDEKKLSSLILAPFWHIKRDSADFNMQRVYLSSNDGKTKVMALTNCKGLQEDDKIVAELVEETGAPAKKRKC
eukprot:TRINITY_DN109317_c0_g1_i1.p1 TRINITY_DN109317_c0_g1~~TRINITY_DN109317_c0_g1_i1.p1  ORF type:complete len:719 (-),score=159.64 TRINITY_DN109317_c0_g1_i1:127-2283(-)